jgi:hypothetical protein
MKTLFDHLANSSICLHVTRDVNLHYISWEEKIKKAILIAPFFW